MNEDHKKTLKECTEYELLAELKRRFPCGVLVRACVVDSSDGSLLRPQSFCWGGCIAAAGCIEWAKVSVARQLAAEML